MKTYKNECTWRDLQDNDHIYKENKPYPREGVEPSEERIEELLSDKNLLKKPLIRIEEDKDENGEFPKHAGGAYFELSNGEKVQGKEAAIEAEAGLKEGDA